MTSILHVAVSGRRGQFHGDGETMYARRFDTRKLAAQLALLRRPRSRRTVSDLFARFSRGAFACRLDGHEDLERLRIR